MRAAYETLYKLYARYAGDEAQLTLIRQQLLAGRLGLYPDCPEEALVSELQAASAQSASPLRLKVLTQQEARYFVLTGKP